MYFFSIPLRYCTFARFFILFSNSCVWKSIVNVCPIFNKQYIGNAQLIRRDCVWYSMTGERNCFMVTNINKATLLIHKFYYQLLTWPNIYCLTSLLLELSVTAGIIMAHCTLKRQEYSFLFIEYCNFVKLIVNEMQARFSMEYICVLASKVSHKVKCLIWSHIA